MPEHYTKNTVEAAIWCNQCGRVTMHRIDSGLRGPCLECPVRQSPDRSEPKPRPKMVQGKLF